MVERATLTKAQMTDAPAIHRLINHFADRGEMLPRSLSMIYENLRDFFVIHIDGTVVACGALHILWDDLAEIKSLAVATEHQRRGYGSRLVHACLDDARHLGIRTVFCLTYQPSFFERFGLERTDVMTLPRKVWGECFDCPKFPHCDEVALVLKLAEAPPAEPAL